MTKYEVDMNADLTTSIVKLWEVGYIKNFVMYFTN